MRCLTIPRTYLEEVLPRLLARPQEAAVFPLGQAEWGSSTEWLAQRPRLVPQPLLARSMAEGSAAALLVSNTPTSALRQWDTQLLRSGQDGWRLLVVLGQGPSRGQATGLALSPAGQSEPLEAVRVVGAGMHRFQLADGSEQEAGMHQFQLAGGSRQEAALRRSSGQALRPSSGQAGEQESVTEAPACTTNSLGERWSRTRGALGGDVWERLIRLRYGIVGCGRTGSLLAMGLAKLGVEAVTLVDPDVVEPGNLGEMDGVTEADVAHPKVAVLAEALRALTPGAAGVSIDPVGASVTSLRALLALKPCDVLINCTDHDGARLAAGILAALYHKVFLDIGTGIFLEDSRQPPAFRIRHSEFRIRRMGADVRLILPGSGCLLCVGGLANEAQAQELLSSADAERTFHAQRDWRQERAGSLRSLNQLAAALGLRLLEDLVGERVRGSAWLRVEFGEDGLPQLRALHSLQTGHCLLCALAGSGDAGIARVATELLSAVHHD